MCSPLTDVWSFGIVAQEILSRGGEPYLLLGNNKWISSCVKQGYRLPQHEKVPSWFYAMMLDTWHPHPEFRPSFPKLRESLQTLLAAAPTVSVVKTAGGRLELVGGPVPPHTHREAQHSSMSACLSRVARTR